MYVAGRSEDEMRTELMFEFDRKVREGGENKREKDSWHPPVPAGLI